VRIEVDLTTRLDPNKCPVRLSAVTEPPPLLFNFKLKKHGSRKLTKL
jgi:hypothetical protein